MKRRRREYSGTIVYEMEVPIKLFYTWVPEEGDGWNEPRMPAHFIIDDYELPTNEEMWKLLEDDMDPIEAECEEDMNER